MSIASTPSQGQQQQQVQTPVVLVDPFAAGPPRTQPRNANGTFAPGQQPGQQQQQAPAQQQASAHPEWLIEQAYALGVSDDDIQAMSSDALGRTVRHLFRNVQQQRQDNGRARAAMNAEPQSPAPPASQQYQPQQQQQQAPPQNAWWQGYREDEVHPSITSVLRGLENEIARLKGEYTEDKQTRQQRQMQSNTAMIDDAFDTLVEKLGPWGAEYYGAGPSNRLHPQSDQFNHRMNALNSGGVEVVNVNAGRIHSQVEKGHQRIFGSLTRGATPQQAAQPQQQQQPAQQYNPYAAAASLMPRHPQAQQQQVQQPQNGAQVFTPEEWAQGGLMQPTARQDMPLQDGYDKAVQNLTAKMADSRQRQSVKDLGMFSG